LGNFAPFGLADVWLGNLRRARLFSGRIFLDRVLVFADIQRASFKSFSRESS